MNIKVAQTYFKNDRCPHLSIVIFCLLMKEKYLRISKLMEIVSHFLGSTNYAGRRSLLILGILLLLIIFVVTFFILEHNRYRFFKPSYLMCIALNCWICWAQCGMYRGMFRFGYCIRHAHCVWDPTKKDNEHCIFILLLILSAHDLNDSKWSEMTPNESVCV